MNIDKSKSKLSTIALIIVLAISAMLVVFPVTTAQETPTKQTYPYINAIPNPVGKNQEVLLHVGIMHQLNRAGLGWQGLTVTVERPDGETETLGPYNTDATGGTGGVYIPTQVGIYYLQTHFPEQTNPEACKPGTIVAGVTTPEGAIMLAGESSVLELVVQEDPVPYYPESPLPEEYWTRPIDAQQREWYRIGGNCLESGFYLPNTNLWYPNNDYAPETAHILWTKPHTTGGLVGGDLGMQAYEEGDAYEGKWSGSIILAGKLYYQRFAGSEVWRETVCVDLHTGEELWAKTFLDNRTLAFGQAMLWSTLQYHGVFDYLWVTVGTTWHAFDAFSGEWVYAIENVPSGSRVFGPKGEVFVYTVNTRNGWMSRWNSTAVYYNQMLDETGGDVYPSGRWRPFGRTLDGAYGFDYNVTIEQGLPGGIGQALAHNGVLDDRLLGLNITPQQVDMWALGTQPGEEGDLLFHNTWVPPADIAENNLTLYLEATTPYGDGGVFSIGSREEHKHYGFSTDTGAFLWETPEEEIFLNWFGIPREHPPVIAYGKLFQAGIGGIVYCYSITDGSLLWKYEAVDPLNEFLFGNNWWLYPLIVTDGKIYYAHLEHSPIDPKPRGGPMVCLNVENGDVIFRANGLFRQSLWGGHAIMGDSIIATQDTYDQRVYAIGRGPSVTTIEAPLTAVAKGTSVTIRGTVMDVSPGTEDDALRLRFSNGVPAVSDADMSEWMLYVYKQFARPDATGVPVKLEAVDPNGEYVDMGTATSDSYGNYGFTFEPDTEGKYMIIATFYGSGAYYGSTATTYMTVGPAVEAVECPEVETGPDYTMLITVILVAVAIAIIIGLINLFALRKQK
jgi:outer membrane protein assembly factor BamB